MEERNRIVSPAGPNRWVIAAAGVLMQLILGTVYSWSVFKIPFLGAHGEWFIDVSGVLQARPGGLTPAEVGLTFTILIGVVGVAAALGGKFVDKAGARTVASLAAILFGTGTILTGVADAMDSKWLLWMGYGVVAGIGNGLGYITPIAVLVRWFPDKRGLITGLAVMGFGFGSAVLGLATPHMLPAYKTVCVLPKHEAFKVKEQSGTNILQQATTFLDGQIAKETDPEKKKGLEASQAKIKDANEKYAGKEKLYMAGVDVYRMEKEGLSLANTFYIFGAVFMLLLLIAAQFLNNPPPGWKPPVAVLAKAAVAAPEAKDLSGALSMPQFYVMWLVLFINVTAGIALISNLSVMAQVACGVTAAVAGTVVFATMIFNGLGRIFWATLSDKLGRKVTFMLILGLQVPLFFILPMVSNVVVFTILGCVILACYGGGFATMPAYAADTFTAKNMGQIYGKILLAWGLAGVVGPMLMEQIKAASGSFKGAVYVAGIMLAAGFVINLLYKKPPAAVVPEQKAA